VAWEHYEHAANIGVRGFGATKAEAFEQAALAMTAAVADPAAVAPRERATIRCEAPDDELLLAAWLNALVYEMATRPCGSAGARAGVYCARRLRRSASCVSFSFAR
jgi:SHS2 domain-containing protein